MATIDEVIKQSLNPFDNNKAGNFWEEQKPAPTVDSIHQEALTQIKSILDQIAQDHQTRTLILYGDAGVGKTHFMGRLKQKLNNEAFFVYVEPFPQSDHIWRHILRYTVDSLINIPVGQVESQLILWLKSCLSTISRDLQSDQKGFIDKIKGLFGKNLQDVKSERKLFIAILKKNIGNKGIYNANEFFGVLYDLTNPDLHSLACEWLKGDDLDEESLQDLQVKQSIDNEEAARGILGNFSKISGKTHPIVLCFDQLDNIACSSDGSIDLQALFNVNSAIHNGKWQSFLIIISIITSTWNENYKRIQPADLDRVKLKIPLRRITLEEGEALLASRLYQLHHKANYLPETPIYPLVTEDIIKAFPGRKTTPRLVLNLAEKLFQEYKERLLEGSESRSHRKDIIKAQLELLWQQEYKKVQGKITKITLLAATELIRMLQEALEALQVQSIKPKLLSGRYASYSLSYQHPYYKKTVGLVWTEDPGMKAFFDVMNACQRVVSNNVCHSLQLIRLASVGQPSLAGNQIYKQIFTYTNHHHIKPNVTSVHYLATYHNLVNSALAQELVLAGKTINLQELQSLIRELKILHKCTLLQDLGVVSKQKPDDGDGDDEPDFKPVKDFMLNLITTQGFMGVAALIREAKRQFSTVQDSQVQKLIKQLCDEQTVKLIDPKAKLQDQLIRLVT